MDGASFQGIAYRSGLRTICYACTEFVKMEWGACMGEVDSSRLEALWLSLKSNGHNFREDSYFRGPLHWSLGSTCIPKSWDKILDRRGMKKKNGPAVQRISRKVGTKL